ncbi:CRE-CATP-3 protein, partial [Aphelenchoides avenae]
MQFANLLWMLLIAAATLSLLNFFLNMKDVINLYVALILYAMIFIMCTLSWYQQMKARKVVSGFKRLLADSSQVLRDGKEVTVNAKEIVLGDIIIMKAGSRVPADVRIIHCTGLKLEAASITGESEPNDYQAEQVPEGVTIFDAHNVAFNGSLCVEGEGIGVVIRVASNTVIGQIAELTNLQSGKQKSSRLEQQILRYIHFLCISILTVSITVFFVGNIVNNWRDPMSLLTNGFLVIATGMVPCGLPATVTSILTLIARKLAGKNVYLKKLDVVEALGQVGIIASDKTGTLTKNQMTVTDLWYYDESIAGLPTSKPAAEGKKSAENYDSPVSDILTCMAVCTSCRLPSQITITQRSRKRVIDEGLVENGDVVDPNARNFTGTPSEVAIINYADRVVDITRISDSYDI